MNSQKLLIVCDDAGFASVDRGIVHLAEQANAHVCAEYLIEADGAAGRAKTMSGHPLVSVGLHFELSNISDADRVAMARGLRAKGASLGEQPEIQRKARDDARRQLTTFRDAVGSDPAHVSTHGDFHLDAIGAVMSWWKEHLCDLFDDNPPPLQWDAPIVRHNKYCWNVGEAMREPLTPDEFCAELANHAADVVEFVLHPALPRAGDAPLEMLFDAEMRVRDLETAVRILVSDCLKKARFDIAPVSSLR